MARTKRLTRRAGPSLLRHRPVLAVMRSSGSVDWHKIKGQSHHKRYKSSSVPSPKEPKKSEMDLSAEVRDLELDASNNPFPESSRPRQPSAMTRYHGNMPKPRKAPREKERHPKSWRKRKVPPTPTDPKMSFPRTSLDDEPPPLATPEVPATRRSEPRRVRTQPEVIDLTGED